MARPDIIAKPSSIVMLASIAVVVAALYLTKGVLVPFTLAVLLSFLLSPVCSWLEHHRLGRIPAVLLTAIFGFSLLGVVAWTGFDQMSKLVPQIPRYQKNLEAKLSSANAYSAAALSGITRAIEVIDPELMAPEQASIPHGTPTHPFSVRVIASPASPLHVFGGMFGTLVEVLGTFGIVIVLVVFFLVRREDLRDRFIHLVGKGHVTLTTQTLEDAAQRVTRYLSILFLLNALFGFSVGLGLFLIGIPNAVLWGILAAFLRFIPYIGPWIAAAMPIGLSMAVSTGWGATMLTIGLFVVLELFNNNLLEPLLYGKISGVSPVAVLVAAVFWMWLWGPVGLLLATPLTVCLLVVGKHVPELSFLDTLLGSEPVFEPKTRIYQRLLAGDQEEATELLEEYLVQQPFVEVYDTVLIPALAMTELHWHRDELDDRHHDFIIQGLREMIQDQHERQHGNLPATGANDTSSTDNDSNRNDVTQKLELRVCCLPAHTEADEIAALLLAQVVESSDCLVQAVPIATKANEVLDLVEHHQADVVCISATPPGAVMHARNLCRNLRARFPQMTLVVGIWDAQCDLNKAKERIGCGVSVVATLADAQKDIRKRVPPPVATNQ